MRFRLRKSKVFFDEMVSCLLFYTIAEQYMYNIPVMRYEGHECETYFYGNNVIPNQSKFYQEIQQSVHHVDSSTQYPPVNFTFDVMREATSVTKYDWYIRCDADTYVNMDRLYNLLTSLPAIKEPLLIGKKVFGRPHEVDLLNTSGYAEGGMCDIFNSAAARIIHTYADACRSHMPNIPKRNLHSDVELSRCATRHGVNLINHRRRDILPIYRDARRYGRFQTLSLCHLDYVLNQHRAKDKIFIHPIKNKEGRLFVKFYNRLLPHLKCQSTGAKSEFNVSVPLPSYVLGVRSERLPPGFFAMGSIHNRKEVATTHFLMPSEVHYIDNMYRLFEKSQSLQTVASFDNDIRFHKDMALLWKGYAPVISKTLSEGGVILLGSAIWSANMFRKMSLGEKHDFKCHPVNKFVFGSFAVLWSREARRVAMELLRIPLNQNPYPFDHIFTMIQALGYPVCFLHPPLVVHGSTSSTTDKSRRMVDRFEVHRWGKRDDFE